MGENKTTESTDDKPCNHNTEFCEECSPAPWARMKAKGLIAPGQKKCKPNEGK